MAPSSTNSMLVADSWIVMNSLLVPTEESVARAPMVRARSSGVNCITSREIVAQLARSEIGYRLSAAGVLAV